MKSYMRAFCRCLFIFTVISCAGSCVIDKLEMPGDDMVYLSMDIPDAEDIVVTRAEASEMEKEIYTVHVLAFDSNEGCFYNEEIYDGYDTKTPYQTSQALGIPKQEGSQYEKCTIWVIANVGKNTNVASGAYDFSKVKSLSDLKAAYGYRLLQGSSIAQRDCLPMTGVAEVNMTRATSAGNSIPINMERVLARVTFSIDVPNDNLEFYFNNWSVESLPRYSYVIPQDNDFASGRETPPAEYAFYYPTEGNDTEVDLTTSGVGKWLSDIETQNFGFYVYENRNGGRLDSPDPTNLTGEAGDYADEIKKLTDATRTNPKFKTLYAPEHASFLIITGLIREKDTKNVTSFAYKIALGANNYDDYNLLRNHSYVYNIHINGINYDDITVDAFDSRVHKAYALQISAPYSTQMDAHYDKRYLDIVASPGRVDLQFYENMKDAEAGSNPIAQNGWIVLSEMDTYNIDIDGNQATYKWFDFNETKNNKKYYIYTDENLSTSSRSAVLKVTHTPEPGTSGIVTDPVSRYYTYTQAGLIKVGDLYVESYEEYGMDLDPYDDENPVTGLQWGWSGTAIDAYDTGNGHGNTSTIVGTSGSPGDFADGSLYGDYAARYCDYKNKRRADGTVIESERSWYLPAIDELIPLTNAVTNTSAAWGPVTMAGKEYWSSSVPTDNEVNTNPFQDELDNATWDWLFWAAIYEAWEWLFRDRVENPNSDYYYTKVAKAAKDGAEVLDTQGEEDGYNLSTYYRRIESKHVRAVRVSPDSGN